MPNSLMSVRNISDVEAAVVERALEVALTHDSAPNYSRWFVPCRSLAAASVGVHL